MHAEHYNRLAILQSFFHIEIIFRLIFTFLLFVSFSVPLGDRMGLGSFSMNRMLMSAFELTPGTAHVLSFYTISSVHHFFLFHQFYQFISSIVERNSNGIFEMFFWTYFCQRPRILFKVHGL